MTFPPEVWDGVLRRLTAELPPFATESWLAKLVPEARDGRLRLLAPTRSPAPGPLVSSIRSNCGFILSRSGVLMPCLARV